METILNIGSVLGYVSALGIGYFIYCMVMGNRDERRELEFDLGWEDLKKEVRNERKKAAQKNTDKATKFRGAKATKPKATGKIGKAWAKDADKVKANKKKLETIRSKAKKTQAKDSKKSVNTRTRQSIKKAGVPKR